MSKHEVEAIEEVMLSEDIPEQPIESEMWNDLKEEQSEHTIDALESLRMWHA